jgi:hypothetical protein
MLKLCQEQLPCFGASVILCGTHRAGSGYRFAMVVSHRSFPYAAWLGIFESL